MCTVVFIPQQGKYILASLRDEDPKREKASKPILRDTPINFIAPIDPQGGGTWVGINEIGTAIILLNGAFVNHVKKESYKQSRGTIVTALLTVDDAIAYWNALSIENIEPFTLIVWCKKNLWQLVWDGSTKYNLQLDHTQPYIWSSSTLYNVTEKKIRQEKFEYWMTMEVMKNQESLLSFFKNCKNEEDTVFIKNTENIQTHSYTSIVIDSEKEHSLSYHDLISETIHRQPIQIL